MKKIIIFCGLMILTPLASVAHPKAVVLLRHAEEPTSDDPHLSTEGYNRAKMLPTLFKTHPALKTLGIPVALFAAGAKKANNSVRSIETLHNLSLDIQVPVNDEFNRDDFRALTDEINSNKIYEGKVVVVVWQHKILREIAEKLGVKNAPPYPPGKYDRIWLITYLGTSGKIFFQDLPQNLMPGDSLK